jgi:hypothetical protein
MAAAAVVAFRGVGVGRETFTKDAAINWLVEEALRASRKIAASTETRRGPQAVARRDACRESAKQVKSGKVKPEYMVDGLIDLDAMTAGEFDMRVSDTGGTDFDFESIMAEIAAVPEG